MRIRLVLITCFLVTLLGAANAHAQTAAGPAFVPGACHFTPGKGYTAGKNLTCGMLVVPENPAVPDGRPIRLAVAIFRTPSPNRQPDPIVFLQGGPGGTIVQDLGSSITTKLAPYYMGNHDLILIDQRGTGLSKPALTCPEVDAALAKALQQNASPAKQTAMEDAALQTCRNRLAARGIDLSQYNTINDASDIADLRIALHLQSMDLYGVSYGTRVAEAVMRYFPTGIRSVVLDSIVTPQYNLYVDPITAEARAFNQLLTGCAQAPKCHKKHPHLTTTFHHLLTYLNKHPLTFKTKVSGSKKAYTVKLNGDGFAEFVRSSMYVTPLIPDLPTIIAKVAKGIGLKFGSVYNHATTVATTTDSMGVYESVTCAEDAQTATPQAIRAAAQSLPKAIRSYTISQTIGQLDMCKVWNVTPQTPPPAPTTSPPIPTLLLEGQYDPITPPANLTIMQSLLPQTYGYVFPYSGHGVYMTSVCSQQVINSFYDNPATTPDAGCVAKLSGPFA